MKSRHSFHYLPWVAAIGGCWALSAFFHPYAHQLSPALVLAFGWGSWVSWKIRQIIWARSHDPPPTLFLLDNLFRLFTAGGIGVVLFVFQEELPHLRLLISNMALIFLLTVASETTFLLKQIKPQNPKGQDR